MSTAGARAARGVALAGGLAVWLFAWTPAAVAQAVPTCAPSSTLGVVKVTAKESALDAPPVATHEVSVNAEFTVSAKSVSLTFPPDVRVIGRSSSGETAELIAPNALSLPVAVTWRQPIDPSGDTDDPANQCAASRSVSLTLLSTRPSRAIKAARFRQLGRSGFTEFAVLPALKLPNLSPLEISARTTSRVRFPSASAKARTMTVPLRTADKIKYRKRLPDLANLSVAGECRLYYLTCATPFAAGGVFTEVNSLEVDRGALRRGIVQGDPNGTLSPLARTQPSLRAARYGVSIQARPGSVRLGKPRPFGYDVQVRQSGRLIARVRRAGRCVQRRRPQGLFTSCRIKRSSIKLR